MPTSQYDVPKLGTVVIDQDSQRNVTVTIRLAEDYHGDLRNFQEPDGTYLVCTDVTALNNPRLAMVMEEAQCWDYDGDGKYDADALIDAIEVALWRTADAPQQFERPRSDFYARLLMLFMPRQPDRHVVFGYGKLQRVFKKRYYPTALLLLAAILAMITIPAHYVPLLQYSVLTAVMAGGEAIGLNQYVAVALFITLLTMRRRSKSRRRATHAPHTYGLLNKAAVYEEQAFREGAEDWSFGERVYSCVAFGAIHLTNLFYPLASVLPLSIGGAVFMYVYLRSYRKTGCIGIAGRRLAVLKSAAYHRLYNRLALIAILIALVFVFTDLVGSLLGFVALVGVVADAIVIRRRERTTAVDVAEEKALTKAG